MRHKKLKLKFRPKDRTVTVTGLSEDEGAPLDLVELLDRFGFDDGSYPEGDGTMIFSDACCPGECSVEEGIECMASLVGMELSSEVKRKKDGSKETTYHCAFGGCGQGKGTTIGDAMVAGHANWNKAGRPIGDEDIRDALEYLQAQLNEGRV